VIEEFERRYERLFGRGSGFRQAGIELVTYRVIGSTHVQDASIQKNKEGSKDAAPACVGHEKLYWREVGMEVQTSIYGSKLSAGMEFDGPAIVRFEATTALSTPANKLGSTRMGTSE
jgi:N-methylhydantoinase A